MARGSDVGDADSQQARVILIHPESATVMYMLSYKGVLNV